MEGIFVRKKTSIWLVLLALCSIFFLVFGIYQQRVDTGEVLSFLILGVLIGLVAILSMLMNRGAYIRIEENRIRAKYHWFGRLDCSIEDVQFVMPQINTLTVLLKSGKRHVIVGIENARALCAAIRKLGFEPETAEPDTLRQQLIRLQAARKKELWLTVGLGALMFANIFIAVALTGGKELRDFSSTDRILFAVMGLVELVTVIALFYWAVRCGKHQLPIEQLKYRLRGAIIVTDPLPSNTVKAVYTDENYTGRIVVCGFPNDESVYYCTQRVVDLMRLETTHTSAVHDSDDQLPTEGLIPITPMFPHN